jgi:hypothetical protein
MVRTVGGGGGVRVCGENPWQQHNTIATRNAGATHSNHQHGVQPLRNTLSRLCRHGHLGRIAAVPAVHSER